MSTATEARLDDEEIQYAVIDIVHNEIEGVGTQGLGGRIQQLLFNRSLQYALAGVRHTQKLGKAEESFAHKEAEKKARAAERRTVHMAARKALLAGSSGVPQADTEMTFDSSPTDPVTTDDAEPSNPTSAVANPLPAQEQYPADGQAHHDFALLHMDGNHYVALVRTT